MLFLSAWLSLSWDIGLLVFSCPQTQAGTYIISSPGSRIHIYTYTYTYASLLAHSHITQCHAYVPPPSQLPGAWSLPQDRLPHHHTNYSFVSLPLILPFQSILPKGHKNEVSKTQVSSHYACSKKVSFAHKFKFPPVKWWRGRMTRRTLWLLDACFHELELASLLGLALQAFIPSSPRICVCKHPARPDCSAPLMPSALDCPGHLPLLPISS